VNSTPQLDLHPDADSLNAFAEQALAAPQSEQVLAHLAACSRCRQVIYLAQQAATEAEAPATRPAPQPGTWFWNWRLAWVPAAAMAAALALVVTFHPWHTAPAPELAKVTPQSEAAIPATAPQERAIAEAAHKNAPAHTANPVAGNSMFGAPRKPSVTLEQEPAPSAALTGEPGATAASSGVGNAFLPSSIKSAPQPEPAVTAWQQEQKQAASAYSASANTSQVSQKSMRAEAYSAYASRQTASAGPRVAQQSQSAPAAGFDMATQQQLGGSTAARKVNPLRLPSGLAVVSRATAQHLTLEIDRAGALFLSDDSGEHWQPVPQQWTGRAIEVRAKTSLTGNTAPEMKFELKNETGSTWASADGMTWTAQ
jgi:hypothetical protein